jgi:hypothetical protein
MRHPALRTLPVGAARASLAGAVLLGLLGPTLAAAAPRQAFIWSAKVTCRAQELPVSLPGVGPGQQDGEETEATDVDVMSFGDAPAVVKIRAVAPANSLGSAPCSSDVRTDEIAAGHALNLTCGDFQ